LPISGDALQFSFLYLLCLTATVATAAAQPLKVAGGHRWSTSAGIWLASQVAIFNTWQLD